MVWLDVAALLIVGTRLPLPEEGYKYTKSAYKAVSSINHNSGSLGCPSSVYRLASGKGDEGQVQTTSYSGER
jgi:hypothetical protein